MAAVAASRQTKKSKKQRLQENLNNRFWRLNHLYYIIDKDGNRVLFKLKPVQYILYLALWWLNVILKSRQHGITTFIAIYFLDSCLFNKNIRAGIIAHRLADAKRIFRDKIKYAYDNLPDILKSKRILVKDDSCELIFNNNSGIYVSTSMRSGTLQLLHISEYGLLCATMPLKAQEIKTGAMETIHAGGMIFVESTAAGPFGDFYDICKEAKTLKLDGKELSRLDYRFHFFPWFDDADNVTDPEFVEIPKEVTNYLDKIEKIHSIKLSRAQRAWYAMKKKRLKHDVYKEQPSTPEEAFIASVEGAYYAAELAEAREKGRITKVPHFPDYPVHTVNDLGFGEEMAFLFFQVIGLEVHIIDCYSDSRKGIVFYKTMLDRKAEENRYVYGKHFAPFDVNKGELGTGQELIKTARQHGLIFTKLPREGRVKNGIQRMTDLFPRLWIDADKCQPVLEAWGSYRRQWNPKLEVFHDEPLHDKSSHYADAGRYLSEVIRKKLYSMEGSLTLDDIHQMQIEHGLV